MRGGCFGSHLDERLQLREALYKVTRESSSEGTWSTGRGRVSSWRCRGPWRGRAPAPGRWAACPWALCGCTWWWVSSPAGWSPSLSWTPHLFLGLSSRMLLWKEKQLVNKFLIRRNNTSYKQHYYQFNFKDFLWHFSDTFLQCSEHRTVGANIRKKKCDLIH